MKKYIDEQGRLIFGTTFIKAFRSENPCPAQLLAYFIEGSAAPQQSDAMVKGNFFETLCLGSTATEEVVTDLPRLKTKDGNGEFKKSTDQLRIETQAALFPKVISNYNIVIKEKQKKLEMIINDAFLIGTKADIFGSIMDEQYGFVEEAYIDIKLTKNINNAFGDFQWHDPELRDHTQAFLTCAVHYHLTQRVPKFYYLVFDYKDDSEHELIEKKISTLDIAEFMESVRVVKDRIMEFNNLGWSTNPSWKNCESCALRSICPAVPSVKPVKRI